MELLINYLTMVFLIVIQSYYYFKVNPTTKLRMPVMTSIASFSMIITPMLMGDGIVGTPYIQLFFILYQVLLFFFSTWEYLRIKKK